MRTTVRLAAARVLITVGSGRATLADELERARADFRDERDRALLLQLTANTLRWRNLLDHLIRQCADRPLSEIHETVLTVLRIAAFELRFHDTVPDHAILNEAVESVRQLRQNRAAGFVNAVLRTMTRTKDKLTVPPRPADASASPANAANRAAWIRYLSITLSHPEWLVTRYLERVGADAAEKWCEYNLSLPNVTVRLNASIPRNKVDEVIAAVTFLGGAESAVVPGAWRLPPGVLTGESHELLRPFIAIQDEGSQFVAHAAAAAPGEHVLDLCAAPGGKSAMFARAVRPGGFVISCDTRPRRLRVLRETLERENLPRRVVRLDGAEPLPFAPVFDRVVVDAPCSGLGTLRRDPDVKWTRDEASLARFSAIQRALIDRASEAVRPGGTLVYATCSSEPEENDDVVAGVLAAHPEFTQRTPPMATRPDRDALDAFFVAVLVRRESA